MWTQTSIGDAFRQIWPWVPSVRGNDKQQIAQVKGRATEFQALTDAELRARTAQLTGRSILESVEDVVQAVAAFQEAARRVTGNSYYDVQLLAAAAMTRGAIAEMATGEGKTYVGGLTSFLFGLAGDGVHLMTTNAYLAQRDFETVAPIFRKLGMTIGLLDDGDQPSQKQAAYNCDVTYGPGYEFGFDYLRDQLAILRRPTPRLGETFRNPSRGEAESTSETIQRGHAVAIIDEADSVLLDEANTPLLLSGPSHKENACPGIYQLAVKIAASLRAKRDYVLVPSQIPKLTETGSALVLSEFDSIANMPLRRPWSEYVEQALFALLRLQRDVHYLISADRIKIVDDFTGRIFGDRTWRGGLHQMVEAKEGLTITAETVPLARISRQQFFQLYERLCGMTGTAQGSEREFAEFYQLGVSVIPTRKPCRRLLMRGRNFATAADKWAAIAAEVIRIHQTGQPILIGTRTIESSESLAHRLNDKSVSFQLLNGKQDLEEATIIARAGQRGAVTVATNMAGRGTDICLGPGVRELGGLHVIIAEPHDSRRVDRQLMGRAARQGDPGSCQHFASADDELIAGHAAWLARHMRDSASADGEVREDLAKTITKVQQKVERVDYAKRRQLHHRDSWREKVMSELTATDPSA